MGKNLLNYSCVVNPPQSPVGDRVYSLPGCAHICSEKVAHPRDMAQILYTEEHSDLLLRTSVSVYSLVSSL